MLEWNMPDSKPGAVGEYRTALDPRDTSADIRRWWNGHAWSNPYSKNFSEELKAKVRKEVSQFKVFWQRCEG